MEITFELENEQKVKIMAGGKEIGHIFTPSGSGNSYKNAVQICGFSEAFDLWGCGIFTGFKDIQLLFDGKKMEGKDVFEDNLDWLKECTKCYRHPCQCEVKEPYKIPFTVKDRRLLKDRIESKREEGVVAGDEIREKHQQKEINS